MKLAHSAAALAAGLALSGPCAANELVAAELFSGTAVTFELKGPYSNVTLSISGPNAFHATAEARRGVPTINLARSGPVADGLYRYQLFAATNETVKRTTTLDDGRSTRRDEHLKSVGASGIFRVKDGAIVKYDPNVVEQQRQK